MNKLRIDISERNWETAKNLLLSSKNIVAITHISPDGDAISSLLALMACMRQFDIPVTPICRDPVPVRFKYLFESEKVSPSWKDDCDLIVCLDASDANHLGSDYDNYLKSSVPLLVIDHHTPGTVPFGETRLIDQSRSSTCELLYELFDRLGIIITQEISTALLTGIITDTGGFRNQGTSSETLFVAAKLVRAGASLQYIAEHTLDSWPFRTIQMLGYGLLKAKIIDSIAYTSITIQMKNELGTQKNDGAHKAIGASLMTAAEINIAVVFVEKENNSTSISMRSKQDYDISGVAIELGGGGHKNAAGCTISYNLEDALSIVLPMLRSVVQNS